MAAPVALFLRFARWEQIFFGENARVVSFYCFFVLFFFLFCFIFFSSTSLRSREYRSPEPIGVILIAREQPEEKYTNPGWRRIGGGRGGISQRILVRCGRPRWQNSNGDRSVKRILQLQDRPISDHDQPTWEIIVNRARLVRRPTCFEGIHPTLPPLRVGARARPDFHFNFLAITPLLLV